MSSQSNRPTKKLEQEWYQKLKESGFEDIEDTSNDHRLLKVWHSRKFVSKDLTIFKANQDVYRKRIHLLSSYLNNDEYVFIEEKDRQILELYCLGTPIKAIPKIINIGGYIPTRSKKGYQRENVRKTVNKFLEEKTQMNVIVRKLNTLTDLGAIYSSWANNVFYTGVVPIEKPKKEWFNDYHEYVKDQIKHARVLVACLNDDHDTIIGFSVVNGTRLEWVGVKWEFREQGVARLLLKNQDIKTVNRANLTKVGRSILNKHPELDQGEDHGKSEDYNTSLGE